MAQRLTVENFDEFDEKLVICQSFSYHPFYLICFSFETHYQFVEGLVVKILRVFHLSNIFLIKL